MVILWPVCSPAGVKDAFKLHTASFVFQELYERCDKLRRAAFKMATETEDNDTSLGLPVCYFMYSNAHFVCFIV